MAPEYRVASTSKRGSQPIRLQAAALPVAGLEPALPCGKRILSPSRLPFRHTGVEHHKDIRCADFTFFNTSGQARFQRFRSLTPALT